MKISVVVLTLLLIAATARAQSPAPVDVDALVTSGFGHLRKNALPEAEADFRRAIDLTPCNVDAAHGLALVEKRRGQWDDARATLEKTRQSCEGNEKALRYLSQVSWEMGHPTLARSLDRQFPPDESRNLGAAHTIYATAIHDWVKNQPDWTQLDLTYIHRFRPDVSAGVTFSDYERNRRHDQQLGLSVNTRLNMNLAFEYLGYFSRDPDFLAEQKHQPTLTYAFPSGTVLGAGARFDKYGNGWATVGRFDARQYVGAFFAEATLLTGQDNFGEPVTTGIGKIGYEGEGRVMCYAGYSYGDETIDQGGGATFPGQKVESVFASLKYFIRPAWGVILAGGPEYRDNRLFRTTGSASVFAAF